MAPPVSDVQQISAPIETSEALEYRELLAEVRLKDKHKPQIDGWLQEFQTVVMAIKNDKKSCDLTDQLWLKSAKVPIIQEPFPVSGDHHFQTPSVCHIIGGYALGTSLRAPEVLIDMAIEIPAKCWQRQDCLNHRYHRKRALYLCHILQSLKTSPLIGSAKFQYINGHHMRPVVVIAPSDQRLAKRFRVSLTAYPESDGKAFRWIRFIPEKNNIRSNWWQPMTGQTADGDSDGDDSQEVPTPVYNASIQHDLNLVSNHEVVAEAVKQWAPLRDSLILLKVWLKQRRLDREFGFCLSLFVCHLLKSRKISDKSGYYHMFRNTLLSISTSKWDSEGVSMTEDLNQPLGYYLSYFPVVFIDGSGYHNVLWDVTIDSYDRLRHESRLTIASLDSGSGFESTFLREITFETKFDVLFKISVPSLLKSSKVGDISQDIRDQCGDTVTAFVGHLVPLMKRVVGKRVSLLQHKSRSYETREWAVNKLPPHPNDIPFLTFGLLINEEYAYNTIERGPEADTEEAKDFKDFWGSKSELRRFQDNSICEAVYWTAKTLSQKRQIVTEALEFILINILDIDSTAVLSTGALLDPMVELKNLKFDDKNVMYGTGEEFFISLSHKLDSLSKKLRSLEGLPLTVTHVQSIDPVFRATEVFPPLAMNSGKSYNVLKNCNAFDLLIDQRVPKYFKPLKVIIQLEGSGKWPDNVQAFRRVRASFHIELAKRLSKQYGLVSHPGVDYVDVYDTGHVFRVVIGSHKELVLLRQIQTPDGLVKRVDSEVADRLETTYEVIPKINGALSALSRRCLCYGISCRLAKRWVGSQMLAHYLDDMAVDLMVAHIFLNPNPYTVPNSPTVGFIRFLSLICDHNWKITPLIVDLNGDLEEGVVTDINAKFMKNRSKYAAMFVTSGYDKRLSEWTHRWPDAVVLNRIQVLATAAKQALEGHMRDGIDFDIKSIFRPDLDIYDVIIRLKSDQIVNQIQAVDFPQKFEFAVKTFDPEVNELLPIVAFDPIDAYLRQLRDTYEEFALFFYDRFGGREIGVLWRPEVFKSQPFSMSTALKCGLLSSTAGADGVQNVATNLAAIVEDFRILGNGIIADIDVKTHNL